MSLRQGHSTACTNVGFFCLEQTLRENTGSHKREQGFWEPRCSYFPANIFVRLYVIKYEKQQRASNEWSHTNEDKGQTDTEGQDVSS